MKKMNFPSISVMQRRRIGLLAMLVIVLIGIISHFSGDNTEMILKTAVLTEDAHLYMNPDLTSEYSETLKAGDLISVVYRHNKNVYYVLDAATEMPALEGYLPKDKFTYDFETANQGILLTDTVYSNKETLKPAGYVVEKGRTRCIINGFDGALASISLPGGIDGLWAEKDKIIYDLNYDLLSVENYGHYNLVKEYVEKEYTSTYDKYYANNYVRFLTSYDEEYDDQTGALTAEFILSGMSKNKYKDPDTVKYIKEAKESIQSNVDRIYYETLYREYNMYKLSNFILKLTATVDNGKLTDVKLYSDMGVGADADWKELEKGLRDFIIE